MRGQLSQEYFVILELLSEWEAIFLENYNFGMGCWFSQERYFGKRGCHKPFWLILSQEKTSEREVKYILYPWLIVLTSFSIWNLSRFKLLLVFVALTGEYIYISFLFRNKESMGTWWSCFCCDLQSTFASRNFSLLCCVSFDCLIVLSFFNFTHFCYDLIQSC